jgi:signal transduction histidine kinase
MSRAWSRLGLRGRLALSIVAMVLAAVALVFVAVRHEVGEAVVAVLLGGGIGLSAVLVTSHLLGEAVLRQRQFVSDASHELRTPLTAIRGQLEVLASEASPSAAEVRRVERVTMTELSRIERLVDDLLTLARLDEEAPLELGQIAVAPYLRGLREDTSFGDLVLADPPTGTLRADRERLTQVIRNLLANARSHAGPDGTVEVSAVARGARLTIRVDDDGPGIPARERERVFDRFHRSEPARDRASGGSGLGLAIARAIVELHGGRIWAEEAPLGGARIAFELPGFERSQLGTA